MSVCNLGLTTFLIKEQVRQFKEFGRAYMQKGVFWMDFSYIVVNILISYYMFETTRMQYFPQQMQNELREDVYDRCIQQ